MVCRSSWTCPGAQYRLLLVVEPWPGRNPDKKLYGAAGCGRMVGVDGGNVFHNGQDRDDILAFKQPKPGKLSTITSNTTKYG